MSTPIDLKGPGRYRLRDELTLRRSQICQPGKIMWWSGRKFMGASDLDKPLYIPQGCDAADMAAADYDRTFSNRVRSL